MKEIFDIAKKFNLPAEPVAMQECKIGHINFTYFIDCENGEKFVLQNINTNIFKDTDILMNNIVGVTSHIRKKLEAEGKDPLRGTLKFYCSEDGLYYYKDENGRYWRLYKYVDNVDCFQIADSTDLLERVGRAFGHFQMQLADYDAGTLRETIPNFHNTPDRLRIFKEAVKADVCSRASEVEAEIAFVLEREEFASTLERARNEGKLPIKVTHNDTKLNNILFDIKTGKPICVIDLDTIMPGYSVNDFGDSIRFGATTAAEDEADLSKVNFDISLYELYVKGFIEGAGSGLSSSELELLPIGAIMMTYECGTRFLTDYLQGDTYFRTSRPGHNLDRARNQFKLVSDMEKNLEEMKRIVNNYCHLQANTRRK